MKLKQTMFTVYEIIRLIEKDYGVDLSYIPKYVTSEFGKLDTIDDLLNYVFKTGGVVKRREVKPGKGINFYKSVYEILHIVEMNTHKENNSYIRRFWALTRELEKI